MAYLPLPFPIPHHGMSTPSQLQMAAGRGETFLDGGTLYNEPKVPSGEISVAALVTVRAATAAGVARGALDEAALGAADLDGLCLAALLDNLELDLLTLH